MLAAAFIASPASSTPARCGYTGNPQPSCLAVIAREVFGARAEVAECIAHFESTDGAYLWNGPNLGPWQINVAAHPWVDARRVTYDWLYAARVAYRISAGGWDWSAWSTRSDCGV